MISVDSPQTVQALAALAHETRLALYRMLVERGPDGLPAGIIADRLNVPPSSLTFHVQHLHRAGLITQRRVSSGPAALFVAELRLGSGTRPFPRAQRGGGYGDRQHRSALASDVHDIPPRGWADGLQLRLAFPLCAAVEPLAAQRDFRFA